MSKGRSNRPLKSPRRPHVTGRHGAAAARADRRLDPERCLHVAAIIALDALGWHVVGLRPRPAGDAPPLWRVTIARYDESATMTLTEADPDAALAELARYAQADAA